MGVSLYYNYLRLKGRFLTSLGIVSWEQVGWCRIWIYVSLRNLELIAKNLYFGLMSFNYYIERARALRARARSNNGTYYSLICLYVTSTIYLYIIICSK